MYNIYTSIEQLIGGTPLIELTHIKDKEALNARVLAKLEYLNPTGSVKDRVALAMIDEADKRGILTSDAVIIEPTSGNTGIGLAAVGASRGYRVIIVMPDSMSIERRQLMKAYGAELILTPGALGVKGAVDKARELAESIHGSFLPGQFDNPANVNTHTESTGPEIWRDTDGQVDIFVAGVGTGGTITGVGRYLKSQDPNIKIVAVEPAASPLLSKGYSGAHRIQGIGADFVPTVLDMSVLDGIIPVTEEQAYNTVRLLSSAEGIFAGISSGAAVYAALILAKQKENSGKNIVVLLPDTGDRYLSELADKAF